MSLAREEISRRLQKSGLWRPHPRSLHPSSSRPVPVRILEELAPMPVTTEVRVRYAETDQMGIVYYANYLIWFEIGRVELLRSLGLAYSQLELDINSTLRSRAGPTPGGVGVE